MNTQRPSRLALPVLLILAGLGCLRPATPMVFHTLQATQAPGAPAEVLAVEVLRVRIPELLQRPQIVLAVGPGSVQLAAGHRWGNPLENDFQRVLVGDLALFLGSDRIKAAPAGAAVHAAYEVAVEVLRCQGRPGGTLDFRATWMITRPAGVEALALGSTGFTEPVPGLDTEALVAAHERALVRLSAEIGTRLRALDLQDRAAPTVP